MLAFQGVYGGATEEPGARAVFTLPRAYALGFVAGMCVCFPLLDTQLNETAYLCVGTRIKTQPNLRGLHASSIKVGVPIIITIINDRFLMNVLFISNTNMTHDLIKRAIKIIIHCDYLLFVSFVLHAT